MVGRDLGERGLAQRFPAFADQDEAAGSTPARPATAALAQVLWHMLSAVRVPSLTVLTDGPGYGCGAEGPVSGADPLEGFGSGLPMGLLTFLFTDIEGSTRLVQNIGADQYGDLQAQHSHLLREAVAEHGGREFGS